MALPARSPASRLPVLPVPISSTSASRVSSRLRTSGGLTGHHVNEGESVIQATAAANRDAVTLDSQALRELPVFDRDIVGTLSRFLDDAALGTGGVTLVVDGMEAQGADASKSSRRLEVTRTTARSTSRSAMRAWTRGIPSRSANRQTSDASTRGCLAAPSPTARTTHSWLSWSGASRIYSPSFMPPGCRAV